MSDMDSVRGLFILGQAAPVRELALVTAEPWRRPERRVRRRPRTKGAREADLCYGECRQRACSCAS
jgi:hypothetical protein